MGIPMWTVPSSAEKKDAAKNDSAATARSPIRRRRYSPLPRRSNARRILYSNTTGTTSASGNDGWPEDPRERHSAMLEMLETSMERRTRRGTAARRPPLPPVPESRNYTRGPISSNHAPDSITNAIETRREINEVLDRNMGLIESTRSRLDARLNPFSHQFTQPTAARTHPSHSTNFAPAQGFAQEARAAVQSAERSVSGYPFEVSQPGPLQVPSATRNASGSHPPAGEQSDPEPYDFPPLRRMSRRLDTITLVPSPPAYEGLDGLGDRERSFSPDDYHHDHWQTIHSTVAPDVHLPSADSSFTSAAASASFSATNSLSNATRNVDSRPSSASSYRTHLTVPSQRGAEDAALHDCVIVLSDAETAEDDAETEDDETRDISNRLAHERHPDDPPPLNPYRYASDVRQRSRDASRFLEHYYSYTQRDTTRNPSSRYSERVRDLRARILNGPSTELRDEPAETEDEQPVSDSELEQMRTILERLARRDDIPEEWWMSAGLTPAIADRLDRVGREAVGSGSE